MTEDDPEADLVELLKTHAERFGIERMPVTSDLLARAANEIECYRGMKDGFTERAAAYEDTISNLVVLISRLSFSLGLLSPISKQAMGYLERKGLLDPNSILRSGEAE